MINFKNIILLLFLMILIIFCACSFASSNLGGNMDNSKQLHVFLNKNAEYLDYPYSFQVLKKNNFYQVIIKSQNEEKIREIPQAYVDKYFETYDENYKDQILEIIFIPGKE